MKRFMLLLAFLISVGTSVWGQEVKEVTLSPETNLEAALQNEELEKITTLKITGPLTEADFATIKNNMSMLNVLDMSGVTDLPNVQYVDENERAIECKGIPESALNEHLNLQEIIFPACVEVIGSSAFRGNSNLFVVDFSKSTQLKAICGSAFESCSGLQSLDLSGKESLESICAYSFRYCKNLKSVNLSKCSALQKLGNDAFYACYSLLLVNLSDCAQLYTIASWAFYSCSVLSEVTLVGCSALKSIENNAFYGCRNSFQLRFHPIDRIE